MALLYKSSLARYRQYLKTVNNNEYTKASFFASLSIGLLIILFVFALRPTLVTIAGLVGQIRENRVVVERFSKKIASLRDAFQNLDNSTNKIGLMYEAIPKEPEWQSYITTLEGIASETGVKILTVAQDGPQLKGNEIFKNQNANLAGVNAVKPTLPEGIVGISFTVSVGGEYEQLIAFIKEIDNKRRVSVVLKAEIDKQKDGTLVATIQGNTGYFSKKIQQ